eukprot:4152695-Alexandrium_andersonii.AAC.1
MWNAPLVRVSQEAYGAKLVDMPFQESEASQPSEPWRACSSDRMLWATCVSRPSYVRRIPLLALQSLSLIHI